MKPALSVIFFTVGSGTGLGVLFWLALGVMTNNLPSNVHLPLLALGMLFTTAGLLSSTLHLANPRNAKFAFARFKTSWLSREGVFALALFPATALFALVPHAVLAALLALLTLAILICTGMIYACLKTVPRWNNSLTPAGYVSMGLYSGALAAMALLTALGNNIGDKATGVLVLLGTSLALKIIYFTRFTTPPTHELSAALPLPGSKGKGIKLLDLGHTHGNFLTDEFFFMVARRKAYQIRLSALVFGFVLPAMTLANDATSVQALTFATGSCLLGLLAERWLFFAEAQHVVRLYHGAQRI